MTTLTVLIALFVICLVGIAFAAWLFPSDNRRKCGNCRAFDLEYGQAGMRDYPDFIQAAGVIPPSRMGTLHDDDGKQIEDNGVAYTGKWDQFGACMVDEDTVLWNRTPGCPEWKRRIGPWAK